MPREDEDDPIIYKEVTTETELRCADTGRLLNPQTDIETAINFGTESTARSKVRFSPAELKRLRTFGQKPGIRVLGFKPRSHLLFYENVKHSYFIYPSDIVSDVVEACLQYCARLPNKLSLLAGVEEQPPLLCCLPGQHVAQG